MKIQTITNWVRNHKNEIAWTAGTWFYTGKSPKAPGTVGSLCSLPLIAVGFWFGPMALFVLSVLLFALGVWATGIILQTQEKSDPGFVVIDETVGQILTFVLVASLPFAWYMVVCGFALFRFFDIVKVWPASYFDKSVHNAYGVMADDVVAGLYAAVVLYVITLIV